MKRREAKKEVAKAKNRAYDELYEGFRHQGRSQYIIPISETQTPSRKGRITGQNDKG